MKITPIDRTDENEVVEEINVSARTARLLLRLLRAAQPISRIELARRLGINRSTVTDTFKPLLAAGLMREEPIQTASDANRLQGRPPVGISFNDERDYFIGINFGVRRTQIGMTTLKGEITAEEDFETPAEPTLALRQMKRKIKELIERNSDRQLRVIGVSVPGLTDSERSKLLFAPNLDWHNVRIAEALQPDESVRVVVENDSTAAAMYEARMKIKHSSDALMNDFIVVRSGTGIGVGMVIGSEVYRGTGAGRGIAGEFGHMTIVAGGKPCVCGNRGCWEKYASAAAAASLYLGDRPARGGEDAPRFTEIVARAERGEVRARRTLEKIGDYLGIGIANVIVAVGIPRVIVSGRLVYAWQFIKKPLNEAVERSIVGKLEGWSIEVGEPVGAAIGGALEVAVEEYLTNGLTV